MCRPTKHPHSHTNQQILKRAAFLPALAFLFGLLFIKETKAPAPLSSVSHATTTLDLPSSTAAKGKKKGGRGLTLPPLPVRLLVLNGFLLMYAFSVETVYAMFIKVRERECVCGWWVDQRGRRRRDMRHLEHTLAHAFADCDKS